MLMGHDIQQLACNPPTIVGIDWVLIKVLFPVRTNTLGSSGKENLKKNRGKPLMFEKSILREE